MEALVALAIGVLVAGAVFLVLRGRTFSVVLGLGLLSYGVHLLLMSMGRIRVGAAPILREGVASYADPLPQALVLTAIVISFGMTAFLVVLALRSYLTLGSDHVDGRGANGADTPPGGTRGDLLAAAIATPPEAPGEPEASS
jgi:multicomponent K+:H+ antiporter subunit C